MGIGFEFCEVSAMQSRNIDKPFKTLAQSFYNKFEEKIASLQDIWLLTHTNFAEDKSARNTKTKQSDIRVARISQLTWLLCRIDLYEMQMQFNNFLKTKERKYVFSIY